MKKPWKVVPSDQKGWFEIVDTDMLPIADVFQNKNTAERIVACVNACAGIPNPEAIPQLVEAAQKGRSILNFGISGIMLISKALKAMGIKPR